MQQIGGSNMALGITQNFISLNLHFLLLHSAITLHKTLSVKF